MNRVGDSAWVDWRPVESADGHAWDVLCAVPEAPARVLVWLPALGVPARHYEAFARALAARGTAVVVHEWRGLGSSSLRASREVDWGYRELLQSDIPATRGIATTVAPGAAVLVGGHSLGGQLATCSLALDTGFASELWLVASGAPYWRAFPPRTRWWLPAAYRLLRAITRVAGALPGRRIGFGGQEARGVIEDWARSGLTGRYAAAGIGDLEGALRGVRLPVRAVLLARDWLAPRSSLDFLVGKIDADPLRVRRLTADELGAPADHFAWMKSPQRLVEALDGD